MTDCNWDTPGHAPFRGGNIEAAVSSYGFDDVAKRELVYKIQKGYNDATVFITRDEIKAAFGKAENLRDMHFAGGKRCTGSVGRSSWNLGQEQGALVYCSGSSCLAVPIICGNISRIDYYDFAKPEPELRPYVEFNHVPEPSTLWLGLLGLIFVFSRKLKWPK